MFLRFFSVFIVWFVLSSLTLIAQSNSWYPTFITNSHKHKTTKPIITRNNIDYVALVELKSLFNFKISFNHKLNGYHYKSNSISLFFPLNSSEVWINHTRHFFSNPSFFDQSCLYVPLNDLALLMGYSVSKTPSSITFSLNKNQLFSATSSLVSFQKLHVDSTLLKFKHIDRITHLLYKHSRINIKKSLHQVNNILYFDPTDFFSALGYKVKNTEKAVTLSYNGLTYTIPYNSRIWSLSINNTQAHFLAEAPLIKKDSTAFPFSSLLAFLDYSLAHNYISNSLELLDNIHGIAIQGTTDPFSITILSRHALLTDFDINASRGLIQLFTIPFSIAYIPKSMIPNQNPYISKISNRSLSFTYEQMHANSKLLGKKQTEITLHLSNKASFYPKKHPNGLFLSQNKILESFSIKETKSFYRITISGFNLDSPNVIKESKKLIFDFNDTISLLAPLKRFENHNFRSIRTSQLSYTPLVSRFILDFNKKVPTYTIEKKKNHYIISFRKEKPAVVAVAKKSSKKSSKWSRSARSSSLRNKVIVLDAGHGGRDPGAVIGRRFYEKKYTLDVVHRVKNLLEKDGAYVILTRSGDHTRSLSRRTRIANRNKGDLFVSVHFNSFRSSKASGSKSFYYKKRDKRLALSIQKQFKKDLPIKSNGVKRSRFYVLRYTRMPAVLIEPLFLSNPKEKKLLSSSSFRHSLATSIFKGIKNYYR
ncbi:hypothetical protein CL657_00780 [bacterium]|nr:hypothetical protein [bacterium]|tara:strand:- start:2303 stop:4420 length:2118 start_codon:yes stop_codon:yes gene_type:complete